jgi:diguanylate cyclase (GGDEF)-like protein
MGSVKRVRAALGAALRGSSRDFYAVADLPIAKRLGGILYLLSLGVAAVLVPLAPPTDSPIGAWGWAVVAFATVAAIALAMRLLRWPQRVSADELLVSSYCALVLVTLLVWLGGSHSPYAQLFLPSVLYTAAVHPPRRVLAYLVVFVAAVSAPLAYEGWSSELAAQTVGYLIIWGGLGFVAMAFTTRVRIQRLGLTRARHEAAALALADPLTRLGNRRAFDEALDTSVARARRSGGNLSLILADLDGFKEINDRWGHLEGDDCLRRVADVLRELLRGRDACFRWGGDEFAILADIDIGGAGVMRERLGKAIAGRCQTPDGRPVGVSLGVAQLDATMSAEDLVDRADLDLLAAKAVVTQLRTMPRPEGV